jgi:hypothetical protein
MAAREADWNEAGTDATDGDEADASVESVWPAVVETAASGVSDRAAN